MRRELNLSLKPPSPMKLLHSRKSALGFWLIEPNTVMHVLVLKFYVDNKRSRSKVKDSITMHEEWAYFESNLLSRGRRDNQKSRY